MLKNVLEATVVEAKPTSLLKFAANSTVLLALGGQALTIKLTATTAGTALTKRFTSKIIANNDSGMMINLKKATM